MKQRKKQAGITVFFSYAHADQDVRDRLTIHLSQLKHDGLIEEWSDQRILAGSDRGQAIDQALRSAHIILLLISADFLASDTCYQTEMQQALERHRRGEVRVIPVLARPCDWQDAPFAHLQCLPRNKKTIITWDNQDEAFAEIVQELRKIVAQQQFPIPSQFDLQRQNRVRLLKRVRAIWIKGLLEDSLHRAAWIDLHLQEQSDALENPWRMIVQELNQAPRPFPSGTNIVEVSDEADHELLILGEPGSGKTTLLLQLARTLLDRAEADERHQIPVVFNLSSWAQKQEALAIWLVEELKTKYQVPRQVGKHWVEAGQVFPLLDGLDEVAENVRADCVQAITAYYHDHSSTVDTPLVICCRSEEYRALSLHLPLQRAVSILPLSDEMIEEYLFSTQGQLEGLQQILHSDTEFYELARRPLMLSIFTLAYQGMTVANFPAASTSEQKIHIVWGHYVKRMLQRRGQLQRWKQEQFLRWLIFVAKQMQQRQQTVLLLEDIHPSWLSQKQERFYRWSAGLVFGLVLGLVSWLADGPLGGLAGGLAGGLGGIRYLGRDNRIAPVEVIAWSWEKAREGLVGSLVFGLLVVLIVVLIGALGGVLIAGLLLGLFLGLLLGLTWVLASGLSVNQLTERVHLSPNEGIWRSGRYGLGIGLFGGLIGVLSFGQLEELRYGSFGVLFFGLSFGLSCGLLFGLYGFVQHFLVRFFLRRTDRLPWNVVPFLGEAAERLLMRKVGGSYIFVHRLLLDYLASLDE